jgi:hypothetical protein
MHFITAGSFVGFNELFLPWFFVDTEFHGKSSLQKEVIPSVTKGQ